MPITPLQDSKVTTRQIPEWHHIPNTSIQSKPLMIYHGAFNATPAELEERLEAVGEVTPQWGARIFVSGAKRTLDDLSPKVRRGDLIIVPAGVGHRLLEDLHEHRENFQMVGAYPHGKLWDMCYGNPNEKAKTQEIKDVAWFRQDPLYGVDGPALHV